MRLILTAVIVFFGLTLVLPSDQWNADEMVDVKVKEGNIIQDDFRRFFNSIGKNDTRKTKDYRGILEQEAAKGQQAFARMKEELHVARKKNVNRQRNLKRDIPDKNQGSVSVAVPFTSEKRLPPLDKSSLRWLIKHNCIVVDKTKYLNQMLDSIYTFFFLSRPRRFGKSLLVDVMNEFFSGEKELFKNTYISKVRPDYTWLKYPVIRIDFTDGISSSTRDEFRKDLTGKLKKIAKSHEVYCIHEDMSPESALSTLIETLTNVTGLNVVILLDEYDAPYATSYGKPRGPDMLESLQSFFRTLKAQVVNIHFLFFTGASTMALSEFMTSTTAADISLMPEYAAIAGFTDEDLDGDFEWAVQRVMKVQGKSREDVRNEMRLWHNGYQFTGTGERVYNPCSVISYLDTNGTEKLFWSKSGGHSTLLKTKFMQFPREAYNYVLQYATVARNSSCLVAENSSAKIIPLDVPRSTLSGNVDEAATTIAALQAVLFHGGYLTIDNEECGKIRSKYYLRFSNLEVQFDYIKRLSLALLEKQEPETQGRISEMKMALITHEWQEFISNLNSLFAQLPYFTYPSNNPKNSESMYQFQLYVYAFQAQFRVDLEVMTSTGRADMVILTKPSTFIFETKLDTNKENPLNQCRKKYISKYINSERKVVFIGLQFSQKAQIVAWGVAVFSNTGELLSEHGPIMLSNWEVSEELDKSDEFAASEEKLDAELFQVLSTAGVAPIFKEKEYKKVLSFNKFVEFISKCDKPKDAPTIVKKYTKDISGLTKLLDKVYEKIEDRKLRGRFTRIKNALNFTIKPNPK